MHPDDTRACFQSHLGLWAVEPMALHNALWLIKQGLWQPTPTPSAALTREDGRLYARSEDGVAVIGIYGAITKGVAKFTGTSTVMTRRALRQAVADEEVRAILLNIDSPGGQVDGVQDLAEEVVRTQESKPVVAYIEDTGASAAYWIASQTQRITANRGANVGSIGVLAVLHDLSGLAEREGVQVHVISTGPLKGVGVPGAPVLPEHLAYLRDLVEGVGDFFFDAVRTGRRLSAARLEAATTGRVWLAAQAQALGLLDGIETYDEALTAASRMRPRRDRRQARLGTLNEMARKATILGGLTDGSC